ncbi:MULTISPECIES: Type 1 glutamine amidotransferase-like domain-containing protein [Acinetobacter]|uniref:Type 1 glutamine amidotransferase-like domain-containing protein n=1 Tax=Acinetobacter TaxID=469 RepID=UPI001C75B2F1|nr:Type 1 glutamine amidotransferase-like domain-containing protein [Acinetobacter sp. Tol 5]BCX74304.1 putative peptidase Lmo0363 [Acinetobacter sp. Tol 5]
MKNLFLAASFADVYLDFAQHIDQPLIGKSVTFIPTASKPESITFYVEDDKKAFEKLGIQVDVLHIDEQDIQSIEATLNRNDFIFVSGGNPFYLLQELKRSQADKVISKLINQGKPYIGSSAGSIVLGQDLDYVRTMDDASKAPYLQDIQGLGLINFSILPHFKDEPFSEITTQIFNEFYAKQVLVPLTNQQFIYIN